MVVAGVLNLEYNAGVKAEVEAIYVPKEYDPVAPDPEKPYRTTGDIAVLKVIYCRIFCTAFLI